MTLPGRHRKKSRQRLGRNEKKIRTRAKSGDALNRHSRDSLERGRKNGKVRGGPTVAGQVAHGWLREDQARREEHERGREEHFWSALL